MVYLPLDYQEEMDTLTLQCRHENEDLIENLKLKVEKLKQTQKNIDSQTQDIISENILLEEEKRLTQARFKAIEDSYNATKQKKHKVEAPYENVNLTLEF